MNNGYCKCKHIKLIPMEEGDFCYWDVCYQCGKHIKNGFHYYNHCDGEDHDDIDIWND